MSQKIAQSVSMILSVFNEKDLLEKAVNHARKILSRDFEAFELILIDDGSEDGTGERMEALAAQDDRVRVHRNPVNLNVGACIKKGMSLATKQYVLFNGIDLPLAVEDIAGLIMNMKIKACDVLVLERKSYAGYTSWRWLTSQINRFFLRLLFRCRQIRDMNFTQIYRREIIPGILPRAESPAFTLPEMILRALKSNLKVQTETVVYRSRPSGKGAFGKPRDMLWTLHDMLHFRMKNWKRL
jgi:glycosyltransferase involved in cell wall biosynthesis